MVSQNGKTSLCFFIISSPFMVPVPFILQESNAVILGAAHFIELPYLYSIVKNPPKPYPIKDRYLNQMIAFGKRCTNHPPDNIFVSIIIAVLASSVLKSVKRVPRKMAILWADSTVIIIKATHIKKLLALGIKFIIQYITIS